MFIYISIHISDGNSVYGAVMSIGLFVTLLNVMDTRFCNLLTNWREEEQLISNYAYDLNCGKGLDF